VAGAPVVHHGRKEVVLATSVLRIADQQAGRFPDVCVLSGVATGNAVRVRAIEWSGPSWILGVPGVATILRLWPGRSSMTVALPVTASVWRMWTHRYTVAMALTMFGLGFVVIGAVRAVGVLVVFGVVVVVSACAYRTRAAVDYWVTCRLDTGRACVTVQPTHRLFDEQARALFIRSIR
jgi:hypothetical protein